MIINCYDEFGIYTNNEDVNSFIEKLVSQGETDDKIVFDKCIIFFGENLSDLINEVMYGNED